MNRIISLLFICTWLGLGMMCTSCGASRSTSKIKVVKPKRRIFSYNPKRDSHRKRTKRVTYKLH